MKKVLFLLTFILAQAYLCAAENPFVGAWKLNIQRSRFTNQRPSSATYIVRAEGEKLRWDWEATGIDPATGRTAYEGSNTLASLDGTPAVMNTPIYDHVSMKLQNPRTIDMRFTKDGKFVRQDRFAVSEDGKTMTVKRGDSNALIVYEKQ